MDFHYHGGAFQQTQPDIFVYIKIYFAIETTSFS